jgi:hypothetical protein
MKQSILLAIEVRAEGVDVAERGLVDQLVARHDRFHLIEELILRQHGEMAEEEQVAVVHAVLRPPRRERRQHRENRQQQRQQTGHRQCQQRGAQLRVAGAAQRDGQHDRGDGDDEAGLRIGHGAEVHVMLLHRAQ